MRKLQIQVLTRDGRKNIYETDRSRNVADLKKHIGRSMNVPMSFSRLTYKGRLLTNDTILEDEGVKRMSTLELHWQPMVMTPKQYRERELEMDKLDMLDQKQRHVSRMTENFEQTVKKGSHERTSSGLRRTRELMRTKRSLSADDLNVPGPARQFQKEERAHGELNSVSSDEMDFLAAYWCCPMGGVMKSPKSLDLNLRANDTRPVSGIDKSRNMLKGNAFLNAMMKQRRLSGKHQPFRPGVRVAAGRMSRSIVDNIRKNIKNCKK